MGKASWGLEVVKGREVGRVFALGDGPTVLGNDLQGVAGLDLAAAEGASPRRMAARQAEIVGTDGGLSLRDLDSPGGSFVNRQRLLAGQTRRLEPGDLIQVGGVQLRVVERAAATRLATGGPVSPAPATTAPRSGLFPVPFQLANGTTCRTWDDLLTASARSWPALRDELISGRLATFLADQGWEELRPEMGTSDPPDERLDAWLARIPTTRPARPEIEVHPAVLRLRALPGGGVTRSKVVVTSTGYRLLRSTARVESPGAGWVRIAPACTEPFTTAEQTEIPIEVEIPESMTTPLSAVVVIASNGGTRRIEVRVEPAPKVDVIAEPGQATNPAGPGVRAWVGGLSTPARVLLGAGGAALLRGTIAAADRVEVSLSHGVTVRPGLAGPAVVLAVVGMLAAGRWALRRGERRDVPAAAFAGGLAGVLLAALAVAACRSIEPLLGGLGARTIVGVGLWALLGAAAGAFSRWIAPPGKSATAARGTEAT
jgi:hypothetical protein